MTIFEEIHLHKTVNVWKCFPQGYFSWNWFDDCKWAYTFRNNVNLLTCHWKYTQVDVFRHWEMIQTFAHNKWLQSQFIAENILNSQTETIISDLFGWCAALSLFLRVCEWVDAHLLENSASLQSVIMNGNNTQSHLFHILYAYKVISQRKATSEMKTKQRQNSNGNRNRTKKKTKE